MTELTEIEELVLRWRSMSPPVDHYEIGERLVVMLARRTMSLAIVALVLGLPEDVVRRVAEGAAKNCVHGGVERTHGEIAHAFGKRRQWATKSEKDAIDKLRNSRRLRELWRGGFAAPDSFEPEPYGYPDTSRKTGS